MRKLFACSILTLANAAFLSSWSFAGERPTIGIVHNTFEPSALQYECRLEAAEMVCEFVQIRARRHAKPEDEKHDIAKAIKEYRDGREKSKFSKKDCEFVREFQTAIKSGKPPKEAKPEEWKEFIVSAAGEKAIVSFRTMLSYCDNPSETNYAAIRRHEFQTKARTCTVSQNTFEQRFKHFPETNTWVVTQEGPQGECGVVNVSRFEPDKTSPNLTFWRYVAKKIVTNKEGNVFLGKCSDLDETEHLFDWRSKDWELGCETIKFGAF